MKNIKNVFASGIFVSSVAIFMFTASHIYAVQESYTKAVSKDISYNNISAPGQVKKSPGMLSVTAPGNTQEQAIVAGPQSFTSDDAGNVYVCDTLNHGIQIYSPKGIFKKTIQIDQNALASDIAVDKNGDMFILDDVDGILYRCGKDGSQISNLKIDVARINNGRGPIHIAGGKIYVSDADQQDVIIGKIENGALAAPTKEESSAPLEKGINASSGRKYYVDLQGFDKGSVQVLDSGGKIIKSAGIPAINILSVSFLKEDKKGNFYVQVERKENDKILLEVYKFNVSGAFISKIIFTDTDYYFWTVKLVSVDDHENIYQFVPSQKKGILNIFKK